MQSIKGTLLLLTLCLGASGIWGKPSFEIFNDIWDNLKDGGRNIVEGLRSATEDGAAVNKDFLDQLSTRENLLSDVSQLGEDLSNAISESLKTGIKDLSKALTASITELKGSVAAEKNPIKRKALTQGLKVLEQLNSVATELDSSLSNTNQKLGEKVNSQLNEIMNLFLNWSREQLERVEKGTNADALKQAKDVITQFISSSAKELINVLEELEVKKTLFEQQLNDKISEYSDYVKELIEAMGSCSGLSTFRCKSLIEESIENLRGASNELKNQLKVGKDLIEAGVKATVSIESLFKKLAENKLKCEKDLDDIVDRNLNTTEANTGSIESSESLSESNDESNGESNDESNSESNSESDGESNGESNDESNIESNSESDGESNSESEGESDGESDGGSNGESNGETGDSSDESSAFADLLSKLSEKSKNLLEKLLKATRDNGDLGKYILEDLHNSKSQFLAQVTQLGKELSAAISNLVINRLWDLTDKLEDSITDLEAKIKGERNLLKRRVLSNGLETLKELNSEAFKLRSALLDVSSKLSDDLSEKVNRTINGLLKWGDEQLQRVNNKTNGEGLKEANTIILQLLKRSSENLIGALNELEVQKSELEQQLLVKLTDYSRDVTALIDSMNQYLLGSISTAQYRVKVNKLIDNLNDAQSEIEILLKTSRALVKTNVDANKAIASLLKQLAKDMLKSEGDLHVIINDYLHEPSSEVVDEEDGGLSNGSSFFGDIGSKLIEGGKSLAGKLWRTRRDTSAESSSSALSETLISDLATSKESLLANITVLEEEIKNAENPIEALNTGLTALKNLNSTVTDLQTALSEINSELPEDLNSTVTSTLTKLSTWEEEQLNLTKAGANAAGVRQANSAIKLLVERTTLNLQRSLSNYEQRKSSFEQTVEDKIYVYTRDARALNDTMHQCLEGTISNGRCTTNINRLVVQLNKSQNDLQAIKRQSKSLVTAGKYAKSNTDTFVEQLDANKKTCEAKVERIIKLNPTTTTRATTTTTTTTPTTESNTT